MFQTIEALLGGADPVSFHDALGVVREARRHYPEGPDPVVTALVALNDSPLSTDGAREVLAEYLKAIAGRRENQRRLGTRPLTLKDHGRTVRIDVGSRAMVHLVERRARGFLWEVAELRCAVPGGIEIQRRPREDEGDAAVFEIHGAAGGPGEVAFVERPPAYADAEDQPAEPFTLRVVVE